MAKKAKNKGSKDGKFKTSVLVENIPAAFLHIFKKEEYNGKKEKYSLMPLFDPENEGHRRAMKELEKINEFLSDQIGVKPEKLFLKGDKKTNSDGKVYDGFAGMKYFKAKNSDKPIIKDSDGKTDLSEDDEKIFAGTNLNLVIRLYALNSKKWKKQVCKSIDVVQYVSEGRRFGASRGDASMLPDVSDDDDYEDDDSSKKSKKGKKSKKVKDTKKGKDAKKGKKKKK